MSILSPLLGIIVHLINYPREHREHRIFRTLLQMVPGLEERLIEGTNEDLLHIADLVSNLARSCDMY